LLIEEEEEEEDEAPPSFLPLLRLLFLFQERPPPPPPLREGAPLRTAASLTHAGSLSPSAAAWHPSRASESLTREPWSRRSQLCSGCGSCGGGGRGGGGEEEGEEDKIFGSSSSSSSFSALSSPPAPGESAFLRAAAKQASPAPGVPVATAAREAASGEEAISVFLFGGGVFFGLCQL